MRLIGSLLSVFVLAACGGTSANPTPAAAPTSSASAQGMPCRLAFTDFKATGFIRYPNGTFTSDPSAAIQPDPSSYGFAYTVATPALRGIAGNGSETFDLKFSRWLPVPFELVSPDSSEYMYSELIPNPATQGLGGPPPLGTRVHVVDVATGKDKVVYQSTEVLSAASFRPEGIYLSQPSLVADSPVPFYLWLVDPATGSARKLLGGQTIGPGSSFLAAGTLWIMVTDPNNPKGTPKLVRVNLSDGSQSTWFEPTSGFAQLLGLDGLGRPVVSSFSGTNGDPGKTWVVTAANTMLPIADQGFTGQLVADDRGLWLTGNGVFLYPPGRPLGKVSTIVGGWILGGCG